jgi:hypothetical protein
LIRNKHNLVSLRPLTRVMNARFQMRKCCTVIAVDWLIDWLID